MPTDGDTAATFCASLVDQWIVQGVRHAVIAPGSRSTPLALALVSRTEIESHVFHDERTASFVALGVGLTSGTPAVVLCSSGTAATHFHAAVVEAHQSNVPMIVCTADRPPELRDVAAPQTIDQTNLYGSAVRWFHDPGVPAEEAAGSWRSLAARAFESSTGPRPGPVHLNLPFREPLTGVVGPLPAPLPVRGVRHPVDHDDSVGELSRLLSGRRGVVVAGRDIRRTGSARSSVLDLAAALGWPVLGDPRSGGRCTVARADPILRSTKFADSHLPEVVLRIGEMPASKVLSQWVVRSGAEIVQIQPTAMPVEPEHRNGRMWVGDAERICVRVAAEVAPCPAEWLEDWTTAQDAAEAAMERSLATWSEPSCARTVTVALSGADVLVVSSSMPIRDVEWFGHRTDATVLSNRGANGIDGVVATGVGAALASGRRTVVHIGDVALVHDSSSFVGLGARGLDIAIVVTNNDGGSIFSFLPQAGVVPHADFEKIYGTPHGTDFSHLAAAHGIAHVAVADADELRSALGRKGPILIEARFDRGANVAAHEAINSAVVAAVDAAV